MVFYFVPQLDTHPIGSDIQDLMLQLTGARTVPRVFIDGAFVGGADDLEMIDNDNKLVPMLKKAGVALKA